MCRTSSLVRLRQYLLYASSSLDGYHIDGRKIFRLGISPAKGKMFSRLLNFRLSWVWQACYEDPVVIQKILDRLKGKAEPNETAPLPEIWAPRKCLFA
ncbi:MAG: hypothetical protein C0631_02750 [Sedimenticola sp.]|nr:MAG: hypothetical protein C0631_02750 [Sedimenticola sp.]